jgi:hypothetical protein
MTTLNNNCKTRKVKLKVKKFIYQDLNHQTQYWTDIFETQNLLLFNTNEAMVSRLVQSSLAIFFFTVMIFFLIVTLLIFLGLK